MKSILKKSIVVFLLSFFLPVQPIQVGNMNDLLMNSIVSNDIKMIQTALVNGADVNYIDPDPMWSTTPLLSAIKRENLTLIKLFLSKGADPNLSVGEGIKQKFEDMSDKSTDEEEIEWLEKGLDNLELSGSLGPMEMLDLGISKPENEEEWESPLDDTNEEELENE